MRICQPHWDALRTAIANRGLEHLGARTGPAATEQIKRQLEGTDKPEDFDPLMSANWAIHAAALDMGGLYLMYDDENGNQYCPLCEADKHGGHAQQWIDDCCDEQLAHARELGLVPKAPQ